MLRVVRAEWERTLAWVLAVGAVVLLFVGYRNVAASPFAAEEVAHLITGGIGALVLLVVAVGLLLSADLRDETDKLDRIDTRLLRDSTARRLGRRTDLVCSGAVLVGLVALAAGWVKAAGTADFDRSLTGLAAAVFGFGLVTAGIAVHCLAARGLVRRRIGALVTAGARIASLAGAATQADGRKWTVDGLTRFHRRSCPALASARGPARPVDGPAPGLEPCLLCHVED